MSDVLTRLRDATADLHRSVEAAMPLLDPGIDRPTYRAYLGRLLGFYEPVEAALDRHPPAPDWPERRKVPLLKADLRALGLDDARIAALPRCHRIPDLDDRAATLGCGYVLEGATLGGRLLRRHLAATWGVPEDGPGLGFFSIYGESGGSRWRDYRAALTEAAGLGGAEVEDKMISAAVDTFEDLRRWLVTDPQLSRTSPP